MKQRTGIFAIALFGLFALAVSGQALGADDMRQAYSDYVDQTLPLRQQLDQKQVELNSLFAQNPRDDAKVKQLFREIADIESSLFSLDADFQAKAQTSPGMGMGNGIGMGMGMHHPGEMNGMMRMGHHGGGWGGHMGGNWGGHGRW